MRVADLWPPFAAPTGPGRDLDELSDWEWGEVIGELGDARQAFELADHRATDEYVRRFLMSRELEARGG